MNIYEHMVYPNINRFDSVVLISFLTAFLTVIDGIGSSFLLINT